MTRRQAAPDDPCGIAQAVGVLGDPWSLLVLRDVAGGRTRFDQLVAETGISRKVLTQRLDALVADGILARRAYSDRPPRREHVLPPLGRVALHVPRPAGRVRDAGCRGGRGLDPAPERAGGVRRGQRHTLPAPVGRRPRADDGPAAADLPRRRYDPAQATDAGRRPRPRRARHALPHPRRHGVRRGRPAPRPRPAPDGLTRSRGHGRADTLGRRRRSAPCQPITTRRSPPSTCCCVPIATRDTVPPPGLVMLASIFIASMVATTPPASTESPSATASVT